MASAVADAIASKRHLVVEAGTGVGKSLGYMVPAILSLEANQNSDEESETKRRIVVSTNTISLQEQLMNKDLPLLNSVIPLEFSAVLAKGRGNYVSLRRLADARKNAGLLFSSEAETSQLEPIGAWAKESADGSRSDLPVRVLPQVWDEIRSDTSNCLGRKCPRHSDCFYYGARLRLQNADILVVNHALFFTDLALRRLGVNLLPDYQCVILDEAQNTTVSQMKMFLTRMGEHSKMVVAGDMTQNDLPPHTRSGLSDALQRLQDIKGVGVVRLKAKDIVRHRLVMDIVSAYDETRKKRR